MNHVSDTATAGNGGDFDPCQAAALLDQVTQPGASHVHAAQAVPGQRTAADHRAGQRGRRGRIPVLAAGRYLPGDRRGRRGRRVRGPGLAWLITGIGLCAVYLGIAAFTAWWQRSGVVRP